VSFPVFPGIFPDSKPNGIFKPKRRVVFPER